MPAHDMDGERPKSREEVLTPNTDDFIIGDRVWVGGTQPGYIQYLGETRFGPGDWAGVVLDDHLAGKNDGSVSGMRYFQCEPGRGVFVRLHKLTRYPMMGAETTNTLHTPACPVGRNSPTFQRCLTPTRTPSPGARAVREGDRVTVTSSSGGLRTGYLRFLGPTDFAAGEWAGVELDEPTGKNDGTVAGKRYFRCLPNHGLFSPAHKVNRISGSIDRHRSTDSDKENFNHSSPKSEATNNERPAENAESKVKRLQEELEQERRKVEELEFRIEEESIVKDDIEAERQKERLRAEDLQRRLAERGGGGVTLQDESLKEEAKKLNWENRSLREKLKKAEVEAQELQSKKGEDLLQAQLSLDTKKREARGLLDRIGELEKELDKNKVRHSKQLEVIDDLNMKLKKSQSKCSVLEEELQTKREERRPSPVPHEARVRDLERILSEERRAAEAAKEDARKEKQKHAEAERSLSLRLRELESNRADSEIVSRLQADRELLRIEKEELTKRLQLCEAERLRWESEAHRKESEVSLLRSQVQRLRDEFSGYREKLEEKLQETRAEVLAVQELHEQIEEQRRMLERVQVQAQHAEQEREQVQATMAQRQKYQAQVENGLRIEVQSLNRRLVEAEAEHQRKVRRIEALSEEKDSALRLLKAETFESVEREKEKLQKIVSELEKKLLSVHDNSSRLSDWKREKEALEQQVHFLNSVVVDMQHTNDDLRSRIDIMEILEGQLDGLSRRTTRLYCDMCDAFDIHDTNDCLKNKKLSSEEREF